MTGVVVSQDGVGAVPAALLNAFAQTTALATDLLNSPGISGMMCLVSGTTAALDGGQGVYVWIPTATGPTSLPSVIVPYGVASGAWVQASIGSGGGGGSLFTPLASAPASPALGQSYLDTTLGYPRIWLGSAWHGFVIS